MNLSPREKDKLLISMAAIVARRRLDRGAVKFTCDRSNLDAGEISRQMAL